MERVNTDYLEKVILKGLIEDKEFAVTVSNVFEPIYFDDPNIKECYVFCKKYLNEYNSLPSVESIINSSPENHNGLRDIINEITQMDFSVAENKQFLLDQSNDYLKEKALKQAMVDSIDDMEDPEKRNAIRERIEKALIKDLKINLGTKYFGDLGKRLRKIFDSDDVRVKTYFECFDEFINGGFPAFTLSVIVAKIHAGKSNIMANFAARQVLNGKNVVLISLEMSEFAFAQRFDSIYSLMDINAMYSGENNRRRLKERLRGVIRNTENRGEIYIKEFPTGNASVNDFKVYLHELKLRGVNPDILYVDYINLMKAAYKEGKSDMYSTVKRVAEELRALSFEFQMPVVSVSQLNREGSFVSFKELNFNYIAESHGVPATADFMAILGRNEDDMVYKNEIGFNIAKNRLGGRVGEIGKFYLDAKSLKMYDECEEDLWISDAEQSGDSRQHFERENR